MCNVQGIDCVFAAATPDGADDFDVTGRQRVDVQFVAVLDRAADMNGATAFEADDQAGQVAADRPGVVDQR